MFECCSYYSSIIFFQVLSNDSGIKITNMDYHPSLLPLLHPPSPAHHNNNACDRSFSRWKCTTALVVCQNIPTNTRAFCHAAHAECVPKCCCKRPRSRMDVTRCQRIDGYGDVFEVNVVVDKGYDDVSYLSNPFNPLGDLKFCLLNLVDSLK